MATASFGRMDEFLPENESVTAYLERIELYLAANDIAEAKRVPVFLSVIVGKTYTLLRNLLAPDKPSTKTYANLVETLRKHFEPKKLVIAERFQFHKKNQAVGETISDYVAELRRLSLNCEFADLNEALRDRLVCGLRSEAIQRKLLTEKDLKFAKALEIAQGMEAVDRDTLQLKGSEAAIQQVTARPKEAFFNNERGQCYRCGRSNHAATDCRFEDAVCHNCGKKGHLARVCRSRRQGQAGKKKNRTYHKTKWVQQQQPDIDESSEDSDLPLLHVEDRSNHPITVEIEVNNRKLLMEVDTGAAVSIISEETQKKLFPGATLEKSSIGLRTYTLEPMTILGQISVQVKYGEQGHSLPLTVVAGKGPSLLGRNWMYQIQLDWKTIGLATLNNSEIQVQVLKKRYQEVFKDELGTMKDYQVSLKFKTNDVTPIFLKPWPVPFAIKEAVGKELDRLEADGILEKVTHSNWAAPIVAVPKGEGQMRLCGDYKVTVNPMLKVDQYPLPRPEDLFASLAGGQKFTKLDLRQAYMQMILEEDSRQYVTINTHQGLYRYTRLPFGIAPAPAIFQRTMDTILQGIPHVLCYIDDLLITGVDDKEHLSNLEEVLKRLQQQGIRLKSHKCHFMRESVEYLGHRIDSQGLHTTSEKIKAIQLAPRPKCQQQLRSFLGLVHYYGKFIPNLAAMLHPMNDLLQKNVKWRWSSECEQAFQKAKKSLTSSTVLAHYDPQLPLRMAADASAYGVGAVISHVYPNGVERPIAYASRTLTAAERNYAQIEKEALSLSFGVGKFHQYVYGRAFTLITDHKPLTTILGPKKGIPTLAAARLQRWALLLSAYHYQIEYKSTSAHANADGLSRWPLNTGADRQKDRCLKEPSIFNVRQMEALPVTTAQLKTATRQDLVLSQC